MSNQLRDVLTKPTAIWRWGFSVVLVGFGCWLALSAPSAGGADTSVIGWIVIGYGLIRLVFYRLTVFQRRRP